MGFFRTLTSRARWIIDRVFWFLILISGISIVTMMFATIYEVAARYIFNRPTSWSVELSSHVLVAPVFLAAAYTLMKGGHVRASIVLDRLPRKVQLIMNIVTHFLALLFMMILTQNLGRLFFLAYVENQHSPGIMQVPLSPVYFVMAVGSGMFCLAMVVKIIDYFLALGAGSKRLKFREDRTV